MEALAPQVISAQERREKEQLESWRCSARDHATKLVVLILYGNPREDEPLQFAWRRALDHLGFQGIELEDLEDEFRFDDTLGKGPSRPCPARTRTPSLSKCFVRPRIGS